MHISACITQDTQHTIRKALSFVERNNTACLNFLFKLSWKENILNIKKRNLVTKLAPAIFPEFHCVALSSVRSFHPTTFFQTGVWYQLGEFDLISRHFIFGDHFLYSHGLYVSRYVLSNTVEALVNSVTDVFTMFVKKKKKEKKSDHLGNSEKWSQIELAAYENGLLSLL